jgi:hypothetical protein
MYPRGNLQRAVIFSTDTHAKSYIVSTYPWSVFEDFSVVFPTALDDDVLFESSETDDCQRQLELYSLILATHFISPKTPFTKERIRRTAQLLSDIPFERDVCPEYHSVRTVGLVGPL